MAKPQHAVSVVAPIYNNAKTFPHELGKLITLLEEKKLKYEILLIDDASSDPSPLLLKQIHTKYPSVKVIFHTSNCGIAATYKELYREAKYPWVVLFSFDGEWNTRDVMRLIEVGETADIIIGKRQKKAYKLGRAIVSYLFNRLTLLLFGFDPIDAGSIKLIKKTVVTSVPVVSKSVYDEAERIIKAHAMGFSVGYIPVDHFDSEKKKGVLTRLPLIIDALKDMLRLFWALHSTLLPAPSSPSSTASSGRSAGKP